MARSRPAPAPDQAQRDAAVYERARNVLIDAGAGTGKTSTLVRRLVEMVAPTREATAVPIGRVAAITFTRKAAGELRLRIRERLLEQLAEERPGTTRDAQLRDALAGLDTAWVGTIHGFSDRLLRLRPVEAGLSPSYEIAEDDEPIVRETFDVLLQAVENGTLAAELDGADVADRAEEATRTVLEALATGLQAESSETEWSVSHGLDALVAGFVRNRDVPPPQLAAIPFDAAAFRAAADEFAHAASEVGSGSVGALWIRRTAEVLGRLREAADPVALRRDLVRQIRRAPRKSVTKGVTFGGDEAAWRLWNRYTKPDPPAGALRDALLAPLDRWLATRLVRLFPVVVALYERVKARRRQLDALDLLAKLRDLLAENLEVRSEFQRMFSHVFVDEFQDTDPLQAEVVLYLCEREPRARRFEDVVLADGKLTLVGDPKQSIYRFRRADVAIYDRVRQLVARGEHLEVRLSANFRSVPPLIEWLNDRFASILLRSRDGKPFDPATGRVFHQPLVAGRQPGDEPASPVHVVEFHLEDGKADEYRALEGRALASTFRELLESSDVRIVDPLDGRARRVRYGDIAVLAVSTWRLSLLFERLDEQGIPYASRGGKLFLEDPLHRQFLLGLRAVADAEDGVAEAALFGPPFFGIDPADLVRSRLEGAGDDPGDPVRRRLRDARALVGDLRMRRFDRPVGTTARDLLERTAFGRAVALGKNGAQRLSRLRELCLLLGQTAAAEGLDYDAVTARFREWVEKPVQLDPPHPVGTEAVQVLTVHQAKGLEFPVVAIWDGRAQWNSRPDTSAWRVERDGRGWMMDMKGLRWEEPEGLGIRATDRAYVDAERQRIVYVAATRARDLLILPKAGNVQPKKFVCGDLLAGGVEHLVRTTRYEPAVPRDRSLAASPDPAAAARLERDVAQWWEAAATAAAQPRFMPGGVSGEAHREVEYGEAPRKPREGRLGAVFGTAVHHAIGLVLLERDLDADEAVRRAARRHGLDLHLDEAAADVRRALAVLHSEVLTRGAALQLEYPVAGGRPAGRLVGGYIDLVAAGDEFLDVIDFKTDAPPRGPVEETYPEYAAQVRAYGSLLGCTRVAGSRRIRCGLLFTADGGLRWVDPLANPPTSVASKPP